jgi:4-amino-4-deoxy-L-arabinose transferase-like glycosyltransferase
MSDEREYDSLAYSLASAASYSYDGVPTAYRPVGYPAIAGSLYYAMGHHPIVVKCFQALLDAGTAFLLFQLLLGYSDRVRILAAGLWAVFIPSILYSNLLMSETASAFLLTLIAFLISRNADKRTGTLSSIGICFGVLVLIKPAAIVLPFFLLLFYSRLNVTWNRLYPAVIAFLLVLSPWVARNYILFGRVALSSNGGINLLIGNNPHTTGAYSVSFDPEILRGATGEFDVDRQAFREASSYIVEHPGVFVVNAVKKAGRFFESEGGLEVLTFHSAPEDTSIHYSTKYASIPIILTILTNLPYFLLLLFGVFGFLNHRGDSIWWFTLLLVGSWLIVHLLYFGGGRFHFPLMPFAAMFAAVSLVEGRGLIRSLPRFRKLIGISIAILLVTLWVYEGVLIFHA